MEILKKLCPIFLALTLAGCRDELELDVDSAPVMCINSLIKADEPVSVSVTHSWFYTDKYAEKDHDVKRAEVRIYANGERVGEDYLPCEGDSVRIVAESAIYGSAEACVMVPVGVPVSSVDWDARVTDETEELNDGYLTHVYHIDLNARLTITDPAGTADYYQLLYSGFPRAVEDDGRFSLGRLFFEAEPLFSEHVEALYALTGSVPGMGLFFTDRQFSGQSYTLNLVFRNMLFKFRDDECSEDLSDCGLDLILSNVSPSYYKWMYYKTYILGGLISDMSDFGFADPVWGYSNVSTGAGVVAAISRRSCTISLRDFIMENCLNAGINP